MKKRIVQWSPHNKDQFLVASSDLRLYELSPLDKKEYQEGTQKANQEKSKKAITLQSVIYEIQQIRCVNWAPEKHHDPSLVAVGLHNGKVQLVNFSTGNKVIQEFSPRHSRTCNAIAWNPVYTNQIAAGLDKVRGDCSTLIWDLNRSGITASPSTQSLNQNFPFSPGKALAETDSSDPNSDLLVITENSANLDSTTTNSLPMTTTSSEARFELGSSEATMGLAWVPGAPNCLVTGTGVKWLRLYDLRQNSTSTNASGSASVIAHAKAVLGVTFDPFHPETLLTFSDDGLIKLWDIRSLTDPIFTLPTLNKGLVEVDFHPARPGWVIACSKEDKNLRMWNLQDAKLLLQPQQLLTPKQQQQQQLQPLLSPPTTPTSTSSSSLLGTPSSIVVDPNVFQKACKIVEAMEPLVSFSMHSSRLKNNLLALSVNGNVQIVSVQESCPISFSSSNSLVVGGGRQIFCTKMNGVEREEDIATIMQERAKLGFSVDVALNLEVLKQVQEKVACRKTCSSLKTLCNWMLDFSNGNFNFSVNKEGQMSFNVNSQANALPATSTSSSTATSSTVSSTSSLSSATNSSVPNTAQLRIDPPFFQVEIYDGILAILARSSPSPSVKRTAEVPCAVYYSPGRFITLHICGWGCDKKETYQKYVLMSASSYNSILSLLNLEGTIAKLEADFQFERAAALAVFHFDLKRAISCLLKGSKSEMKSTTERFNMQLVAMALAGCHDTLFSSSKFNANSGNASSASMSANNSGSGATVDPKLWKETILDPNLQKQLKDQPYLRSCFHFISNLDNKMQLKTFVEDSEILLTDRIAFACRYFDDNELLDFVSKKAAELSKLGSLEGLLLTGLTDSKSVDLLECFVNFTADVQSAAVVMSHVVPKKFKDGRVDKWVKLYRELLDHWELFHERAKFDIARNDTAVANQIFARCNFCNSSLSAQGNLRRGTAATRSRSDATKTNNQKQKTSSCPSCKKPLPRCALCLMSLSCAVQPKAPSTTGMGGNLSQAPSVVPFDDWFTWCQTCRHGGHTSHIMDWFKTHSTCPVTDCDCKCLDLH